MCCCVSSSGVFETDSITVGDNSVTTVAVCYVGVFTAWLGFEAGVIAVALLLDSTCSLVVTVSDEVSSA